MSINSLFIASGGLEDAIDELADGAIRYSKGNDANDLLEEVEGGMWLPKAELLSLLEEYGVI